MNNSLDEDLFPRNAQSFSKIYHTIIKSLKFLHKKPLVKNMNFSYYDFYYTVIKNRDKKENVLINMILFIFLMILFLIIMSVGKMIRRY